MTQMMRLIGLRPPPMRAVFLLLALLIMMGCRFSYDLEGDRQPTRNGRPASTDGSWTARLGELILPLVEEHDTEWATSFDENTFKSLAIGSTSEPVEERLGRPLETKRFPDGNICWYYTRPGEGSKNYFVRVLEFDQDGTLVARRRYFHVD